MTSIKMHFVLLVTLFAFVANLVFCHDIEKTDIKTVTDETRFSTVHPDANLSAYDKVNNVKGNIIFKAGERIGGKFNKIEIQR